MIKQLKSIDRNITISASDSGQYQNVKYNWMPGGTFASVIGEQSHLVKDSY